MERFTRLGNPEGCFDLDALGFEQGDLVQIPMIHQAEGSRCYSQQEFLHGSIIGGSRYLYVEGDVLTPKVINLNTRSRSPENGGKANAPVFSSQSSL